MNWLLKVDEKVYMCGIYYCYGVEYYIFIKLGFIDINFFKICEVVDKKVVIGSVFIFVQCCDNFLKKYDYWLEDFYFCILLFLNVCLVISLNDVE